MISGRSSVRIIEDSPTKGDTPTEKVVIKNCGELDPNEKIEEGRKKDDHGDGFESHPSGERQ